MTTGTADSPAFSDLLFEIGKAITLNRGMYELLQEVLGILSRHLPVRRGMISIYQRETEDIVVDASFGYSDEEIVKGRYKPGEGVTGSVFSTGCPVIIPSVKDDPRFLNKTGARGTRREEDVGFICVPVRAASGVIGTISLDIDGGPGSPLELIAETVTALAVLIAHAVDGRREMLQREGNLKEENRLLRLKLSQAGLTRKLIGNSIVMRDLYEKIFLVADTDSTVLITGESGTGKELAAEEIHYNSPRRNGPFIKVNIAAIPPGLIESELFGHEKGAFTGALRQKKGRFELAEGGTIFLDEIGDLSLPLQVHLLLVIQERRIERLGGSQTIPLNVRIITATHQDLEARTASGEFRQDLFYRINVFPLHMPSLRERRSDILLLANHFLEGFNRKMNRRITGISPEAADLLQAYSWPGNVRELENCLERAVIISREDLIETCHLPPTLQPGEAPASGGSLKERTDRYVRGIIVEQLKETGGNITRAARALGTTKRILTYKIKSLGIDYSLYENRPD